LIEGNRIQIKRHASTLNTLRFSSSLLSAFHIPLTRDKIYIKYR
jgi:hypothetical protein